MMITEPKWKSYIVTTNDPVFTPEQCQEIIKIGREHPKQEAQIGMGKEQGSVDFKKRTSDISWIPFGKAMPMYRDIEELMLRTNNNHFGFQGMQLTELAQYTEYQAGGFYDWHVDNDIIFEKQPPVRKISMTLALSPDDEYEGGGLELMEEGKFVRPKQGHAVFFASFCRHRAVQVTKGIRRSLVMWFGGPPFK
jgi:PKHD-type hydroxylase|tara:strand:- start:816 stop:1397 length:582 start_codon:yes stop_codon:yes gene_type:complete